MTSESLRDQWEQHLLMARKGGAEPPSTILESWRRSAGAGVPPDDQQLRAPRVEDAELARRLKKSRELVEIVRPHLEGLSACLADVPHVVYLTDSDGIILSSVGDQGLQKQFHLSPGHDWSERAMGTNGAGTALAVEQAVAVIGPEHYCRAFENCTCTAAPLRENGQVVGAIDISTGVADARPDRLLLVSYVARVIDRELQDKGAIRQKARKLKLVEELRESDALFRTMADSAPAILWVTNETHECTFLSQGWADFTGQPVADGLGFGWSDAVHPEDRDCVIQRFLQAEERCEAFKLEHRIRHWNGDYRWVIDVGRPRHSETGEFIGFVGSVIDVHERKLMEETLRDSEARERARAGELATLLDAVPAGVFMASDPHCTTIRTNATGNRMLDLHSGETPASSVRPGGDEIGLEARGAVAVPEEMPIRRAAGGEVVRDCELDLVADDGRKRHLIGNAVPLLDESGKPRGAVCAFTDITARKRAEAALQESEARFREMTDGLPLIVWVRDAQGEQQHVNKTFCDFFGVSGEEAQGGRWQKLLHPDDVDAYAAKFLDCVRERREFHAEARVRHADGQWHWLESWGKPRFDAAGEFRGFVGTSADVTARKAAEDALRDADRSKNAFLAMLGHELRNPLAPLRHGVELLRNAADKPELLDKIRPMMERQIAQLLRLVDDLCDLSRISRGKIELQRARLDLHEVIDAAVEMSAPLFRDRRQELVVRHADGPLPLYADLSRLVQVIGNLLSNAGKFAGSGDTITLRTEARAGEAVVELSDPGLGIPPERLSMLFEMFAQVPEHSSRANVGGLGIGLSLARQIVELHGGTIRAESEGLGRGSRFTVRLPLRGTAAGQGTR